MITSRDDIRKEEGLFISKFIYIYATMTTGFSKMYLDAALLLDGSKDFGTHGFPEYMNIDPYIQAPLEQ